MDLLVFPVIDIGMFSHNIHRSFLEMLFGKFYQQHHPQVIARVDTVSLKVVWVSVFSWLFNIV
ncbi:MAG: hypothetical protein LBV71_14130 [Prevotella sp.]|nr:hypothetical protein [Prevotella sp.]